MLKKINFVVEIPALTSPEILTRDASLNRNLKLTGPVGRLTSWVVESGPTLDSINKQLEQTQETIVQLERIMGSMELSASSIGGGGDAEVQYIFDIAKFKQAR